jgi:hypothetical protein
VILVGNKIDLSNDSANENNEHLLDRFIIPLMNEFKVYSISILFMYMFIRIRKWKPVLNALQKML